MELSQPNILTKLARVAGGNGKVHFGGVWGIKQGVKRKRQEICAAVDGHSISIYETQDGGSVSSYPIPATAKCHCSPCSVRVKHDQSHVRNTYCALENYGLQLRCFTEDYAKPIEKRQNQKTTHLSLDDGLVVHVAVSVHSEPEVLVVQQNGLVSRFGQDLQTRNGQVRLLSATSDQGIHPVEIRCFSVDEARKSILKQRGDILTTLDNNTTLLASVYSTKSSGKQIGKRNLNYGVWLLESTQVANRAPLALKPLFAHELHDNATEDVAVSFNPRSTCLTVSMPRKDVIWNTTSMIPVIIGELKEDTGGVHSTLCLTPEIAVTAGSRNVQLLDTRHQAQISSLDLTTLKRKRNRSSSESGPIRLIAFFPQSNRVLAVRRNNLMGIDIRFGNNEAKVSLKAPMLSDSVGQGISDNTITPSESHSPLEIKDSESLEKLISDDDPSGWSQSKSLQVLQKMFAFVSTSSDLPGEAVERSLKLNFVSTQALRRLTQVGVLNLQTIRKALAHHGQVPLGQTLPCSAVTQALKEADPSLTMLSDYLETAPLLSVEEVADTVEMLLQQALRHVPQVNGDTLGHEEDQAMTGTVTEYAFQPNVTLAQEALGAESLPANLSSCLSAALRRFGRFTAKSLSKQVRASLTQTEVIALIQYLRQQLFRAGHTSSAQGEELSMEVPIPNHLSSDHIAKILSTCVDAIGPMGFIPSESEDDFTDKVISDLLSEISQATLAIEEFCYLQGVLRETLRFSESMRDPLAVSKTESTNLIQVLPLGNVVTLYSEGQSDGVSVGDSMLPLSLRNDNIISSTKVRKVGGQVSKRSAREVAMLEHRQKGMYSYERLVL